MSTETEKRKQDMRRSLPENKVPDCRYRPNPKQSLRMKKRWKIIKRLLAQNGIILPAFILFFSFNIAYGNPTPTPSPTPMTLVLTVNKKTGAIIKQSIPAGTRLPCNTPVVIIYK